MVDLRNLNSDAWLARASNAELNEYAEALAPILGRKRGGKPRHEVERLPEMLAEERAAAQARLERRRKKRRSKSESGISLRNVFVELGIDPSPHD